MRTRIFNPFSEAAWPASSLLAKLITSLLDAAVVLIASVREGVAESASFDCWIERVQGRRVHELSQSCRDFLYLAVAYLFIICECLLMCMTTLAP